MGHCQSKGDKAKKEAEAQTKGAAPAHNKASTGRPVSAVTENAQQTQAANAHVETHAMEEQKQAAEPLNLRSVAVEVPTKGATPAKSKEDLLEQLAKVAAERTQQIQVANASYVEAYMKAVEENRQNATKPGGLPWVADEVQKGGVAPAKNKAEVLEQLAKAAALRTQHIQVANATYVEHYTKSSEEKRQKAAKPGDPPPGKTTEDLLEQLAKAAAARTQQIQVANASYVEAYTRTMEEKGQKAAKPEYSPPISPISLSKSPAFGHTLSRSQALFDLLKEHNTGDYFDLLVLGAGPAGVKAAVECANRGFRVGLIDPKDMITGSPTGSHSKCLREAVLTCAKTWSEVRSIIDQAMLRAEAATANLLQTFHIELLKGSGSFVDQDTILFRSIEGETRHLKADCLVIATGSRANRLPMIPFHLSGVFDSDTIGRISYIPKNMVVQGAGIIGLEYAVIFAKLGTKVIVVEFFDKVVPNLDKDLQQALLECLDKHNVEIRLKTPIKGIKSAEGYSAESPLLLVDTGDTTLECDCVLSATGRSGASDGIGLEKLEHLGIKIGQGKMIEVDEFQHTGVANIYAVGDVAGGSLATLGQAQAMRAIRKHFGSGALSADKAVKPCAVWTIPEIAWAGMTEETAAAKDIDFGTVRAEYSATVRGTVTGDTGFLKLVFDSKDGTVLGVHICGEHASELVNYGAEVVNDGDTIYDMLHFVFPAVSYHELYHITAHQAKMHLRGVRNLSAATVWNRIRVAMRKHLKSNEATITFEKTLYRAFQVFDTDGRGVLSVDDLRDALTMLGLNVSSDVVKEMVDEVELGGDGLIDYQELTKAVAVGSVSI